MHIRSVSTHHVLEVYFYFRQESQENWQIYITKRRQSPTVAPADSAIVRMFSNAICPSQSDLWLFRIAKADLTKETF